MEGHCLGSVLIVLWGSMRGFMGRSIVGVELCQRKIVSVFGVGPLLYSCRALTIAFLRREALWQHGRGDFVFFWGVKVWLWPRTSPVRRVSPLPFVVSFKPGCRLFVVSSEGFLGGLMAGCRSGGVSLKGVGKAHRI